MQTERGQPIEEKDGYLMVPHTRHNNSQYWRCFFHDKYGCKARGSSEVGFRIIRMTKDHNDHLPDPALAAGQCSCAVWAANRPALGVIGVFKKRSFVPCAYFLLPNKEAATYERAFTTFFTLPELRNVAPSVLMADFEVAPTSAVEELLAAKLELLRRIQYHLSA